MLFLSFSNLSITLVNKKQSLYFSLKSKPYVFQLKANAFKLEIGYKSFKRFIYKMKNKDNPKKLPDLVDLKK